VPQGTLSRLMANHLVPQGTHPLSPDGDSPCEYVPVRWTAASLLPTVR